MMKKKFKKSVRLDNENSNPNSLFQLGYELEIVVSFAINKLEGLSWGMHSWGADIQLKFRNKSKKKSFKKFQL